MHGAPQRAIKRVVVISDGFHNLKTDNLIRTACGCRNTEILMDVVFVGEEPDAAALLPRVSGSTINGRFIKADELAAIRRAVVRADPLPHFRVGATVVASDTSGSMSEPLRGTTTTRLQAAVRAAIDLAVTKRVAFGRQPARVRS